MAYPLPYKKCKQCTVLIENHTDADLKHCLISMGNALFEHEKMFNHDFGNKAYGIRQTAAYLLGADEV